jgi:NAD(P)H dehydrogenase (quinone)
MENCAWDVEPARKEGKLYSCLQPLDRPFPLAAGLGGVLGRTVEPVIVPRSEWVGTFVEQGTPEDRTPLRVEMLDGLNGSSVPGEAVG